MNFEFGQTAFFGCVSNVKTSHKCHHSTFYVVMVNMRGNSCCFTKFRSSAIVSSDSCFCPSVECQFNIHYLLIFTVGKRRSDPKLLCTLLLCTGQLKEGY